jgi:hypothetical protein
MHLLVSSAALSGREGGMEMAGAVWCAAIYTLLSPMSFIERATAVYGALAAVVCEE